MSLGCPYYNPHIGRPFEKPDDGNYEQPEHPLLGVDRHFRIAGELQRAFPDLPMVGTGYSWLQKYAINAGGRTSTDGNIRILRAGRATRSLTRTSRATPWRKGELDEAAGLQDAHLLHVPDAAEEPPARPVPHRLPAVRQDVYGPIMKEAREAAAGEHLRPKLRIPTCAGVY